MNAADIRKHLCFEHVYFALIATAACFVRRHAPKCLHTVFSSLDLVSLISEYDMEVRHYITAAGIDRFQDWLDELQDVQTIDVILRRRHA